jgi:hypothetical protein
MAREAMVDLQLSPPMPSPCEVALAKDGAWLFRQAVAEPDLMALERQLPSVPAGGERIAGNPDLADWIDQILLPAFDRAGMAPGLQPVRAIVFDKTAQANWAVGWHQDRTVAVKRRVDADGYGPWSLKRGIQHVEPPFDVMARLITIRLHLDAVDAANAPLRVALGSHSRGRIVEALVPDVAAQFPIFTCLAERGDVWIYATTILHASSAAARPHRRRVLQIDLARDPLPGGVEWLGIA